MLHTPSRPARSQPFPIDVLPRPTTVDVLDGRSQIPIVPSCLDSPRSVLPSSCLPNRFQRKCDSPCWASLLSKGLALFYSEPVPRLASFLHSELLRGVHHVEEGKRVPMGSGKKETFALKKVSLKTKDTNKENSLELHFRWM